MRRQRAAHGRRLAGDHHCGAVLGIDRLATLVHDGGVPGLFEPGLHELRADRAPDADDRIGRQSARPRLMPEDQVGVRGGVVHAGSGIREDRVSERLRQLSHCGG